MSRRREIAGNTRIFGVMGYPVAHSLSPAMQNAAFEYYELNKIYLAFTVLPGCLTQALTGLRALGATGVNVTLPYKEAVARQVDLLSPEAQLIGAVNVLRFDQDCLVGHNTDGTGFLQSLEQDAGFTPEGKKIVVLGAGGAARAVALTLARFGAAQISIANRTRQRAADLATVVESRTGLKTVGLSLEPTELSPWVKEADLVVQATSVGLYPKNESLSWFNPEWLSPTALVCDLIYRPRPSEFLKGAALRGCRTLDGLGMLLYQGAQSFSWWTSLAAPVDVMRQSLLDRLG